jgi:hypothetical protein
MRSDGVSSCITDFEGARSSREGAHQAAHWRQELERAFLQLTSPRDGDNGERPPAHALPRAGAAGDCDHALRESGESWSAQGGEAACVAVVKPRAASAAVPTADRVDVTRGSTRSQDQPAGWQLTPGAILRTSIAFDAHHQTRPASLSVLQHACRALELPAPFSSAEQPGPHHLHVQVGPKGVAVWVRDAALCPAATPLLLAGLAEGLARDGRRIVELHLNGRRVYRDPDTTDSVNPAPRPANAPPAKEPTPWHWEA